MINPKRQIETINLDGFNDVSLYQLIPSGKGFGQALLKTYVDTIHIGKAPVNSLLIVAKTGLKTTSTAFFTALGIEAFNQIDASLIQTGFDFYTFFFSEIYEGYLLTNVEQTVNSVKSHLFDVLFKKKFRPYNYVEQKHDIYDFNAILVMTTKNIKKVPAFFIDNIDCIVQLEDYTADQLELIVLQRLKYSHISYENENVLKEVVRYGKRDLDRCIRFLKSCINIMQSQGRQMMLLEDVLKSARLNRLSELDKDDDSDIPF